MVAACVLCEFLSVNLLVYFASRPCHRAFCALVLCQACAACDVSIQLRSNHSGLLSVHKYLDRQQKSQDQLPNLLAGPCVCVLSAVQCLHTGLPSNAVCVCCTYVHSRV